MTPDPTASHAKLPPTGHDRWDRYLSWSPLFFLVIAFLFWGARNLWDSSEARYGQAAFEMLRSGNWLIPSLGGQPHLTKPPLAYWLISLGMKLFGINAWGARFFLSIAFLGTIMAARELAATMGFDRRTATAAALIYATGIIPFGAGHTLTTDGFLVLWETLAILAAWKVWQGEERPRPVWRLIFWVTLALAFLTKGPPGWLPFVVIGAFRLLRRPVAPDRRLFSPLGFGVFLVLSFWWYGLIIWRQPELLGYFLHDEVYQRIFTTVHHRNAPFWIYLPVLLLGVGPWLVLWPWLCKQAWRSLPGKNKRPNDWQLFLVLWVALPLAVFTVAKSRLVFYVLPLFVPLALGMSRVLISDLLPRLRRSLSWRNSATLIAVLWLTMCVIYTNGVDRFAANRSMSIAAKDFTAKAEQLGSSRPFYWIWGTQPYSLAFNMHRAIKNTESLPPEGESPEEAPPLLIARNDVFHEASHLASLTENGRQPQVLATSQGCVLFTLVPSQPVENHHTAAVIPKHRRWIE